MLTRLQKTGKKLPQNKALCQYMANLKKRIVSGKNGELLTTLQRFSCLYVIEEMSIHLFYGG
jgi:hypothetical protein